MINRLPSGHIQMTLNADEAHWLLEALVERRLAQREHIKAMEDRFMKGGDPPHPAAIRGLNLLEDMIAELKSSSR